MSSLPAVLILGAFLLAPASADASEPTTAEQIAAAARPAPKTRSASFQLPSARPLAADYVGSKSLRRQLDGGLAQPTALAADDFDEDGVPDLVSGYTGADGGLLTLHRGNVDAVYSHSPEARQRKAAETFTDAPFLTPGRIFEAPAAPDFLGAGDFDNDGHRDVVAAARGGSNLYLFPGDGRGGLGAARFVALGGQVTAMIAGEISRKDNLADVVVGIDGEQGPAVLVFQGPLGALDSKPKVIALPAAPTALALGRLDDDVFFDLAVAAGRELMILHGWDSILDRFNPSRSRVLETIVELDSPIASIAVGRYVWDARNRHQLALLSVDGTLHLMARGASSVDSTRQSTRTREVSPWQKIGERHVVDEPVSGHLLVTARVSGLPMQELVILDRGASRLQVTLGEVRADPRATGDERELSGQPLSGALDGAPVAALPMRLNRDALNDLVLLQEGIPTPTVAGSVTSAVITVDATTDSGPVSGDGSCQLSEAIANASANSDTSGGDCAAGSGADTIEFAVTTIDVFAGLPALTDPDDTIDGTTACGTPPCVELRGNNTPGSGLTITASGVTVRGLVVTDFDLASELEGGIHMIGGGDSFVEGNTIKNHGGGTGIIIDNSAYNTVGGTALAALNRIYENFAGMLIWTNSPGLCDGNKVLGNYIGTDGTDPLGNSVYGINLGNCDLAEFGGSDPGAGNVISANGLPGAPYRMGLVIHSYEGFTADSCIVQGNHIGTDVSGTEAWSNWSGLQIWDASSTLVGGPAVGARNVISGNDNRGVNVVPVNQDDSYTTGNVVQGNYIGTDASGTVALGNGGGVELQGGDKHLVGGSAPDEGNVISGNNQWGVYIAGGSEHRVEGNLIGTDVTGTVDLGNTYAGIHVKDASNNTIGGSTAGARNIISGNDAQGVELRYTTDNQVLGNLIGLDVTGTLDLGNTLAGVHVLSGSNNTIGGMTAAARNIISGNDAQGVFVEGALITPASSNQILGNFIGTDVSGTTELGNTLSGIALVGNADDNTIGGTADGAENVIAYNGEEGIVVTSASARNVLQRNSIHSNSLLGIDLGNSDGITPNDPSDPDTGPNLLQNFPTLTRADRGLSETVIGGWLQSMASTTFRVELFSSGSCDPSGCGEGETYLGSVDVTTSGSGDSPVSTVIVPTAVPVGHAVTATATDPDGNTSEFSDCFTVSACTFSDFEQTVQAQDKNTLDWGAAEDAKFVKGPVSGVGIYSTTDDGLLFGATTLDISGDNPGAGTGLYYLLRQQDCGSWQTAVGEQPDRDAELP